MCLLYRIRDKGLMKQFNNMWLVTECEGMDIDNGDAIRCLDFKGSDDPFCPESRSQGRPKQSETAEKG
jgi:hypothetical protein